MTHFSLKRTLAQYLNQAICPKNHAVDGNFIDLSCKNPDLRDSLLRIGKRLYVCHQDIPLKKINHPENVVYTSAIARTLQAEIKRSVDEIAEALLCVIKFAQVEMSVDSCSLNFSGCSGLMSTFEITHQPSGWLQFSLSTAGLDRWLQQLNQGGLTCQPGHPASGYPHQSPVSQPPELNPRTIWQIQYIYSCCCTLLRRAAIHQIIKFDATEPVCPEAAPCAAGVTVDRYRLATADSVGDLTQYDPSTQQLIHTLIDTTDKWAQEAPLSALRRVKLAIAVAAAFDQFHRANPPWRLELKQQRQWYILVRAVQVILQRLVLGAFGTLVEQL